MRIASVCLILIVSASVATADLMIRVPNVDSATMSVAYTMTAAAERIQVGLGSSYEETREFVFPEGGFDFAGGPVTVRGVTETSSGKELAWEVIPAPGNTSLQAVRIFYPYVLTGQGTQTTLTVEAKSRNVSKDADGRYVFKYETSHRTTFEVPKGHRLVYTNYPVTLYEKDGLTCAEATSTDKKSLIFKTRTR